MCAQGKVRWAMAGPDLERLEHVKLQLTRKFNAACKDVPLLDCDVDDPISVDRTVASTTAIINLAGPYVSHTAHARLHGSEPARRSLAGCE